MNRTVNLGIGFLSFSFATVALATDYKCTKYTKFPVVLEGCEGEACWTIEHRFVLKETRVYESPDDKAKVIDTLKKCEPVTEAKPYLVVRKLEKAKVDFDLNDNRIPVKLKKGDSVEVVHYEGEGNWKFCVGNELYSAIIRDTSVDYPSRKGVEPWLQLKTPRSKEGYVSETKDLFGDENQKCSSK